MTVIITVTDIKKAWKCVYILEYLKKRHHKPMLDISSHATIIMFEWIWPLCGIPDEAKCDYKKWGSLSV